MSDEQIEVEEVEELQPTEPEFVVEAREVLSNADRSTGLQFAVVWHLENTFGWRVLFRVIGSESARYLVESVNGKTDIYAIDDAPIPDLDLEQSVKE